ncbi:hypothetical protein CYMTET_40216 [Cymbomonas tetramitiformis]|uniref:Uncharacterized protein n=1 Tax=Cymbomonas tetramitiformis TaxID=36881 RepID=A0AAE0F4U8_9CHLO|nr:hypothetical protein CYMTET_40216 [Cymbomonas tetramitiformis]
MAAVSAEQSGKQPAPMPPPPKTNAPFPSWSQVTSEFTFGADTFMGRDTGTLSGEKRAHPTTEIFRVASPSKRAQVTGNQAKSTSATSAVALSLGAQQTLDAAVDLTQVPQAVPERDNSADHALVSASATQGGPAKGDTSGDEFSSMDHVG